MKGIRIIVAGDNYLFSKGMECLIEESPTFELVASVANESELMDKITAREADVLAIDLSSIEFDIELLERIKKYAPALRILAFNSVRQKGVVSGILVSGVTSYLLLCCDKEEITEALIKTSKGERFLCGKVVESLIHCDIRNVGIRDPKCELSGICGGVNISEREMEIIRYVSEGLSNQEIAGKLFLSVHTINTHRKNIMSKLGINNTAGLVMYAVRNQLVN